MQDSKLGKREAGRGRVEEICEGFSGEPGAGEIVELAGAGEDNEADLGVAENRELLGFLQQPVAALRERHLPACGIVYATDHDLPPSHRDRLRGSEIRKRKGRLG
ncbi:hypothetical protein ACLOJK_036183 [Asimina triloba]